MRCIPPSPPPLLPSHPFSPQHQNNDSFALVAFAALAAAPASAQPSGKLTLLPDPLDLSGALPGDYRNWAAVLAQVMLATEGAGGGGDASPAVAALGRVLLATHARLAAAADGSGPPALFPRFHMKLDDKLAGALGKGKADPKWAAHFGLDGTHPVPAGCPGGDVPGGGSDGGHNHSAHSGGGHADAAADTLSEPITAQRRAAPSSSASARRLVPGLAPGVVRPRPGAKAAAAAKAPAGRRGLRQDHEHEHEHEEEEEGGGTTTPRTTTAVMAPAGP